VLSLHHDTIWPISKYSSVFSTVPGDRSLHRSCQTAPLQRPATDFAVRSVAVSEISTTKDKVQLAKKHEYREEAQRGTEILKLSRCFPVVYPHTLIMLYNADEDIIVPFTFSAPNSLQVPVYHMPAHSTNLKVILA